MTIAPVMIRPRLNHPNVSVDDYLLKITSAIPSIKF